jgi:hypothetical protein
VPGQERGEEQAQGERDEIERPYGATVRIPRS